MDNVYILNEKRIIEDFTVGGKGSREDALRELGKAYGMSEETILSHGHSGRIISRKFAQKLAEDNCEDYFLDVKDLLFRMNATGTTLIKGNIKIAVSVMVLEYPDRIYWSAEDILEYVEQKGIMNLKLPKIHEALEDGEFFIKNEDGRYELNIGGIVGKIRELNDPGED